MEQHVIPNASRLARSIDSKVTWLAVPEPVSWAMALGGLVLIGGAVRRRRDVIHMGR